MKLVPIYINRGFHMNGIRDRAHAALRWLGVPRTVVLKDLPPMPRHSFDTMQGHAVTCGIVMAPGSARLVAGKRCQLLAVPTPDGGLLCLSAADVAEQASIENCGLKWATGRPEAWQGVKAGSGNGEKRR
jgi:hypothetical protein